MLCARVGVVQERQAMSSLDDRRISPLPRDREEVSQFWGRGGDHTCFARRCLGVGTWPESLCFPRAIPEKRGGLKVGKSARAPCFGKKQLAAAAISENSTIDVCAPALSLYRETTQ